MAKENEKKAIEKICFILRDVLQIASSKIEYKRYDEIWFKYYDPTNPLYEWVKGCPDYYVRIEIESNRFIYFEIKLKSKEFMKTVNGGLTQNGTIIMAYGCSSFYLDIDPVYINMNKFSKKQNISHSAFIIAFVKNDLTKIRVISLAKINEVIKNGWNKDGKIINICKYGEGYGKQTYLIPEDITTNIYTIDRKMFLQGTVEKLTLPQKI